MSFQDLVKFMTQEFVQYMDTPRDERLRQKSKNKQKNWSQQWFGVIPTAISMLFKRH
ncbi:YqzE family protein [Caldalkalibacillus salinus]|uniref:YqzE family protein n=1 Tax=Caldalkalibacillus salinus TaxID=2803787 RepID=UPI001924AAF3|nr:YqzE family protein [Caldalkalibacillus salinus]